MREVQSMNPGSPDTDITAWASQSIVFSVLVGLAKYFYHGTAVGTLFTLNCLERMSDVLLKL